MSELKSAPKVDGIILFADGSCIPNPGHGGWGVHGYTYSNEVPKKGSGQPDYYVTSKGYVEKSFLDAKKNGADPWETLDQEKMKEGAKSILEQHLDAVQVTPIEYFDMFGSSPADPDDHRGRSTNNRGEIFALLKALEFCKREDIRTIQIHTDSSYTLEGWNKILPLWAKNKWCRRDGEPIKSKDLWQQAWDLKNDMREFDITAQWVQGHSIFLGNNIADVNANLGKNMTVAGMIDESCEFRSPAQGYWSTGESDRHPLMAHQKLFFNGEHEFHVPGTYYMGAVDKDLGLLGKRLSDTSYSVLKLKEPIPELEKLIAHQCDIGNQRNQSVVAHLATFYKPHIQKQFMEYGSFSFYRQDNYKNDLSSADKQLVTEAIEPPKQVFNALLAMNNVAKWLNEFLEKTPEASRFTMTDLTSHLYESSTVQKKKQDVIVTKLKASIKPGVASIAVDANYRDSTGTEFTLPTVLSFGIDLADRNGLKRVEEFTPKVTLLSWEESPGVFRYFTVIQTNDDVGAYCGYYSNVRLNKAVKNKTT